jgi:hypothetical protein
MQFWRLHHPDYDSDYRSSYINGSLEHPFGLPGVQCDVCRQTWGGSRILPFECPVSIRGRKHLKERWPIALEQHQALQREVQDELRKAGIVLPALRPGDDFQPACLDVPSRPRADFLWSSLGSVVVSDRVRALFQSERIGGVAFCPVTLRRIGKREAKLPPPMPSTGEPEDIIDEVPLLTRTGLVGPYYEMVILSDSAYPPGGEPVSVCSGCGRESIANDKRQIVMRPSMWLGGDIFFLATTLHIIISDRLRGLLQKLKATNVEFKTYHEG